MYFALLQWNFIRKESLTSFLLAAMECGLLCGWAGVLHTDCRPPLCCRVFIKIWELLSHQYPSYSECTFLWANVNIFKIRNEKDKWPTHPMYLQMQNNNWNIKTFGAKGNHSDADWRFSHNSPISQNLIISLIGRIYIAQVAKPRQKKAKRRVSPSSHRQEDQLNDKFAIPRNAPILQRS